MQDDGDKGDVSVTDLRCEYVRDPLDVETRTPRLGWCIATERKGWRQRAFQVCVASDPDALERGEADLWDSGCVASDQSVSTPYGGSPLVSDQVCWWRVRVWGSDGSESAWSAPASWEMGLLDPADWGGTWIGAPEHEASGETRPFAENPAPLFRKAFHLPAPVRRARLAICGLGYYEASLNGARLDESVLDPAWTDPARRIAYRIHDVTDCVHTGENCLGVMLGNGWFAPQPLKMWGHLDLTERLHCGEPCLRVRLLVECVDGSRVVVVSDESWRSADGPVRFNNIYLGELYDARQERPGWDCPGYDPAADWAGVRCVPGPSGCLTAQRVPPIREVVCVTPVGVSEPEPGVWIVDMGRNLTGWMKLSLEAPAGTRIEMRYGELLNAQGRLNPLTATCGQIKDRAGTRPVHRLGSGEYPATAWQADVYLAKGDGRETFRSHFSWHGFRYVELRGLPQPPRPADVTVCLLRSAVEEAGSFHCSDDLLNEIQTMCTRTFESNLMTVQSDCPHRERFGYGGDIVATMQALLMNYDMSRFYAKSVEDWHDAALEDGHLTDTAPDVGMRYCGIGWEMVHPLLLLELYRFYGDRRLLEEQYATARACFLAFERDFPDGVVTKGLADHSSLLKEPVPPLATALFAHLADVMQALAEILGCREDQAHFERSGRHIRAAFRERFLDPATGRCDSGSQSCQAFALFAGCVPEEQQSHALGCLLEALEAEDGPALTTGIFGTRFVLEALSERGRADVVLALAQRRTVPGWGYMLANGATTLWENWTLSEDVFSHNHPMFGSISAWFFRQLGGIVPDADAEACDRMLIAPYLVSGLDEVCASYASIRGIIRSRWIRQNGRIRLAVEIPPNAVARVRLPIPDASGVWVSDAEEQMCLEELEGVSGVCERDGNVMLELGSGRYEFVFVDTATEACKE